MIRRLVDDLLIFQIEPNHAGAAHLALIIGLMVVEPFDLWIVNAADIADILARLERFRLPGAEDFSPIDQSDQEQNRASGHLVRMKASVMCSKTTI